MGCVASHCDKRKIGRFEVGTAWAHPNSHRTWVGSWVLNSLEATGVERHLPYFKMFEDVSSLFPEGKHLQHVKGGLTLDRRGFAKTAGSKQ